MRSSRTFKSSSHCIASPDGRFIATLNESGILVRSTETLQTTASARLTSPLLDNVTTLLWSPSSSNLLVYGADQIQLISASDGSVSATISSPTAGTNGKPTLIRFGARDTEVLVYAAFGLKLLIFDVTKAKAVEVAHPKFHTVGSAWRGLSLRPETQHVALLTRASGKDLVSLHHPTTRQVQRSWNADSVDAQGLAWTPDGRWLLLWDSPAHGHRLLLYTPDGQLFRSITAGSISVDADADLHTGITLCKVSPNAELCALGDHSRRVAVLRTDLWTTTVVLHHPNNIVPKDTLQIWQEQLHTSEGRTNRTFVRSNQTVSPPSSASDHNKPSSDSKAGCSLAIFDASSNLVATKLEDSPSTIWIWDILAGELRSVLLFHANVTVQWHPSIRELMLITPQGASSQFESFVWDPLSDGPTPIAFDHHLPGTVAPGKAHVDWLNWAHEAPALLLSDENRYAMLCVGDGSMSSVPWHGDAIQHESTSDQGLGASSLRLAVNSDEESALEDTFSFKNP